MPERLTVRRSAGARALAAVAAGALGAAAVLAMPSSAGADEDFIVGSGRADARILRVGPAAGQLALAPTIGLSLSDFLGTLGRGEARVADYGALDGSVPPELKSEAPDLRTESTEENAAAGKQQTFAGTPAGSPLTIGAMEQRSAAATDPKGSSEVTLGKVSIPGLIEIGGSTAASSAQVIDKKAREARGTTTISSLSLGGGAVVLKGLTWEAVQRTGEGAKVTGSFRVEGLTIGGQSVPVPADGTQLAAVLPQINAALAPTGLVLDAPVAAKDGELARVTPLGVRIVNSQVGQTAVAPVVGALQPVREPVTAAIIEGCDDCKAAILVADVLAGVVTGGGRFDLEIGGVTGYTEGTRYDSPFNFNFSGIGGGASSDFAGGDFGAESFGGDLSSSSSSFDASSTGLAGTGPVGSPAAPAAAPGVAGGAGGATGTLAASAKGVTGTTGGAAALIGLVGLLGAVALGAADFRAIRAARRTIPTA